MAGFSYEGLQSFSVGLVVIAGAGMVYEGYAHDLCSFLGIPAGSVVQQTYRQRITAGDFHADSDCE
jgi:hypothetical protein